LQHVSDDDSAGFKIKVSVSLVASRRGFWIWSEKYQIEKSDQEEIIILVPV
jgi:TolB-like protein